MRQTAACARIVHEQQPRSPSKLRPTLPPAGVDLDAYRNKLLDRFSNPHIEDTLLRLAEDGSQKLQTTMRPVLLDHFSAGQVSATSATRAFRGHLAAYARPAVALLAWLQEFRVMSIAIGAWIRFMTGIDEQGEAIHGVKDPAGGEKLKELAINVVADPNEVTVGILLKEYFGEEVASHPGTRATMQCEAPRCRQARAFRRRHAAAPAPPMRRGCAPASRHAPFPCSRTAATTLIAKAVKDISDQGITQVLERYAGKR